jgi:iron(III) transport system ATP-binding protein
MSKLTVTDLRKGYSAQPVLQGVDLAVPAGSLTAVLGLSGCGKTTLLRVIAGFERAETGQVSLGARVLDDGHTFLAPERRGIGYVPQEGALFPHLTVRKNIGFGLSRSERRGSAVADLLEMVGLASLAERYPHQLSGGEQQRVALARALAPSPRLVLLDEPFSALDAALRGRVREEVHALLRAQGVTTVLVTHDQEEALSLADTVAVLREGTIVQDGAPAELYERPADTLLAGFLGAVNVVSATFRDGMAHTPLGVLALRGGQAASADSEEGAVMVRPEQLEVYREEQSPNALAGEVTRCRYYGHDALLYIRPLRPIGQEILIARVSGELALQSGTRVGLSAHGPVSPLSARDPSEIGRPENPLGAHSSP